ncbi:SDR family oxidoreductase [Pandoraea pulmonicola]|uniref:3-oxoacyl-[acyl-carrier-protein] reductase FabG n=1 Tax=Pandoraea pulmonicola TaxID=93221 RepID=A0AAJ4ZF31_PANPU|nr:SDR family oxidoreductase [Pandoraea pulmonicola]AJC19734.1 oxidoreductase [Pandoraea pulmonicola]SUA92126.1 3-oxoacyl-[acyl-carrier-protein] reductase FabG [Pandoraea pulmonicola]
MATNFQGKVAFVTGGSRGIGAAIVQRFADEGAAVAFTYKGSKATAEALAARIQASGGRALALQADAADAAALTRAINDAAQQLGRIDILVNNAGVFSIAPVADLALEEFDRMLDVNVRSVFVASKAALAHMGDGGRIINIGSCNADRMAFVGGATYSMSKAALVGLVKGMARDLGPRGITVNNVQPGPTNTDMNPAAGEFAGGMHDLMALKRHARPEEIAAMVAYVASDEAGFVTGASLTIDGGYSA